MLDHKAAYSQFKRTQALAKRLRAIEDMKTKNSNFKLKLWLEKLDSKTDEILEIYINYDPTIKHTSFTPSAPTYRELFNCGEMIGILTEGSSVIDASKLRQYLRLISRIVNSQLAVA